MKNKINKKIIGWMIVASLLATIGAVLVSADNDENADDSEAHSFPFFGYREKIFGPRFIPPELTDEQKEEIEDLITSLKNENASCEEIREAVFQKLDEMGILDERLDNAIDNTEKRLEILNRQKELRNQGYSWDEINDIIKEEFDLEFPENNFRHSFREQHFQGFGPGFESDCQLNNLGIAI